MNLIMKILILAGGLLFLDQSGYAQFWKSVKLDADRGFNEIKLGTKLKDIPGLTFAADELFVYGSYHESFAPDYYDALSKLPAEKWYVRKDEILWLNLIKLNQVYYGFLDGRLTQIVGFFDYEKSNDLQYEFYTRYGYPGHLTVIEPRQTEVFGWRGEKVILKMEGYSGWHFSYYLEEPELKKVKAYCSEDWQRVRVRKDFNRRNPDYPTGPATEKQIRKETKAAVKECEAELRKRI